MPKGESTGSTPVPEGTGRDGASLSVRPAVADDEPFLTRMLVAAALWRPDYPEVPVEEMMRIPEMARYITGWPQPGDLGVVAEADRRPVGASWLRFFPAGEPGYGFVDEATPELTLGVVPHWRGRGAGSRVLEALISAAKAAELPAISLSVNPGNDARRLYERFGFVQVSEAAGSAVLLRRL